MKEHFSIRIHGNCELAQLYFPYVAMKSASVQLRRWIILNKELEKDSIDAGFKLGYRIFTPKQVEIVIDRAGEN